MEIDNNILIQSYNRLSEEISELKNKIDIAVEGLKAVISQGDILGIAQKTLDEMNKDEENELPQKDITDEIN